MNRFSTPLFITTTFLLSLLWMAFVPSNRYVTCNNHHFELNRRVLSLRGCNYWYGGYLAYDSVHHGKERLQTELDFLQQQGINNVRVFFCGEGQDNYAYRISPALQPKPGQFNENILRSFDYLLAELNKRGMTAVIVLNNNWEWSGGFGEYLEWSTHKKAPLPKTADWDWDAYCAYIAPFYSNTRCQQLFRNHLKKIILRRNSITGNSYSADRCILAWELSNEPRPMLKKEAENYFHWIQTSSEYIKQLDPFHLVTTGVEGMIGTNQDYALFKRIHALPSIDYATIHLWPGIWQWYQGQPEQVLNDSCKQKIASYFSEHAAIMNTLKKPLVLEEFGLQRDGNSFSYLAGVSARDSFYQFVYSEGRKNNFAGFNFWGFAGVPKADTSQWFWKKGEPYSADPPQEQQGLFSVFTTDITTWKIIASQGQYDDEN